MNKNKNLPDFERSIELDPLDRAFFFSFLWWLNENGYKTQSAELYNEYLELENKIRKIYQDTVLSDALKNVGITL